MLPHDRGRDDTIVINVHRPIRLGGGGSFVCVCIFNKHFAQIGMQYFHVYCCTCWLVCVRIYFCLSNVWLVCQIVSQVQKFNFWLFKSSCGRYFFHVSAVRGKKGFYERLRDGRDNFMNIVFLRSAPTTSKVERCFSRLASVCTSRTHQHQKRDLLEHSRIH